MLTLTIAAVLCFIIFPECSHRSDHEPNTAFQSEMGCASWSIAGYTDKISYYPGDTVTVFLQSSQEVPQCELTVFSINHEAVFSFNAHLVITAPPGHSASENGFELPSTAVFMVPEIESGVYLIENKIPFIVKSKEETDLIVVYPSNTANAYSLSGGKNLYSKKDRPIKVSFQRPIGLQQFSEYCLKWFTTLQNFDVGYIADIDLDDYESINGAKLLIIPGHSEYWTRQARTNFDRFVGSGGDALILSGNTMWWQVRYTDNNTKMICYKNAQSDPVEDPALETIEWNTPSLRYSILSSIGAHFPDGGYGLKDDNGWNGYKIVTPESPLFESLQVTKGDIIALPSLEYDGTPIAYFDNEEYPVPDTSSLSFFKFELLGFDRGHRLTETTATFIIFQKTKDSGTVINTSSTDWCSINGMGGISGDAIKTITYNAIEKLLNDKPVFSR